MLISVLLNVVAPVLICILIGYVWGRSRVPYATEFVTRIVTLIGAPCLIVATMNKTQLKWDDFLLMARLQLMVLAGATLLGYGVLRFLKLDFSSLGLAVVMPNVGNMGLSLCLFAFGDQGLALALIIFIVTSLIHFASGDVILSREGTLWRRLVNIYKQPLVYGALAAIFLITTETRLPPMLANTTELLGGMTIPLMLVTLGVSLSQLAASYWLSGCVIALTRIGGGLIISSSLVWALELKGLPASILIVQATMPSAVFNYLFAIKHDREAGAVASGVVISTLLSAFTTPLLLWWLVST